MSINVRCHTNLDLMPCEKWPDKLPAIPSVGDIIESAHRWNREQYDLYLQLRVVAVRWRWTGWQENVHEDGKGKTGYYVGPPNEGCDYAPYLELHLPTGRFENLTAFYEWYGRVTGKGRSFFI